LASPLILVDVPRPDLHEWFNLRRLVRLDVGEPWGVTTSISEVGAEIVLTQAGLPTIATEKRSCDAGNSGRGSSARTTYSNGIQW